MDTTTREESPPSVESTLIQGNLNLEDIQDVTESAASQGLISTEFKANMAENEDCITVEVPRQGKKDSVTKKPRMTRNKKSLVDIGNKVTRRKFSSTKR